MWWPTGGILQGPEPGFNDISQDLLTKDGFTIGNAADKAILTSPWNKLNASQLSILAARGIGLPYAGYDTNQTVSRIIRAFPQYNNAVFASAAPLGKTWYEISPNSLLVLQPAVERHISEWLWNPVLQTILEQPTWLVLGVLGAAAGDQCAATGPPPARGRRISRINGTSTRKIPPSTTGPGTTVLTVTRSHASACAI